MGEESRRINTNNGPNTLLLFPTVVTNSPFARTTRPADAAGSASLQSLLTRSPQTSKPSAGLIITVLHTETLYRTIPASRTSAPLGDQRSDGKPTPTPTTTLTPSSLGLLSSTVPPPSRPTQHELCVVGLASSGDLAVCRETDEARSTTISKKAPSQPGLGATSLTRQIPTSHDETTLRQSAFPMATRSLVTVASVDTSNALSSTAFSASSLPQSSTTISERTSTSGLSSSAGLTTTTSLSPTVLDAGLSSVSSTTFRTLLTSAPTLFSSSSTPLFFTLSSPNPPNFITSSIISSSSASIYSTSLNSSSSSSKASASAAPLTQSRDNTPSSGLILGVAIGGAASLIILLLLIVFLLRRRRQYRDTPEDVPRLPAVQVPGPLVVPLPASMDPQNNNPTRAGPHRYTMRTASGHDVSTLTQSAITSYGIRLIPREEPPPNVGMSYGRPPTGGVPLGHPIPPAVIDYAASNRNQVGAPAAAHDGHSAGGFQRPSDKGARPKIEPYNGTQPITAATMEGSPDVSHSRTPLTRSSPGQPSLLGLPRPARSRASSHTSFETGTHTVSVYSLDSQGRRRRSDPFSWQNVR